MSSASFLVRVVAVVVLAATGCKRKDVGTAALPSRATTALGTTLAEARRGFTTKLTPPATSQPVDGPADDPPSDVYQLVHYPADPGPLAAYVTPPPTDGKRHPAVVWCHGGYGGLSPYYAFRKPPDNDQTPAAFVDAGYVVMVPSWRGQDDNPGRFEMFYGEVNDVLAAVRYVSALPGVDPTRVYVVGHSVGGTLALLAVELAEPGQVRAAFSFGGAADMNQFLVGDNAADAPFDVSQRREMAVRSATLYVDHLQTPTWYFEGEQSPNALAALAMANSAEASGVPFHMFIVRDGTHSDILRPLTHLLAERLLSDAGPTCNLSVTYAEVKQAYIDRNTTAAVPKRVHVSVEARSRMAAALARADPAGGNVLGVEVDLRNGVYLAQQKRPTKGQNVLNVDGLKVAIDPAVLAGQPTLTLAFDRTHAPPYFLRPATPADP